MDKKQMNSLIIKEAVVNCLKKLSPPALAALAYLLRSKMANEPFTEGHEIITSLVYDPEQTIAYLYEGYALKAPVKVGKG